MDLTNITLDGVPVAVAIEEQETAEVREHRESELRQMSRTKAKPRIPTKHRPRKQTAGKAVSVKVDARLLAEIFVNGTMTPAELEKELSRVGVTSAADRKAARYEMAMRDSGLSKKQVARLVELGWTVETIAERLIHRRLR